MNFIQFRFLEVIFLKSILYLGARGDSPGENDGRNFGPWKIFFTL